MTHPSRRSLFNGQGRREQNAGIPCLGKRTFPSDMSQFHVCSQAARNMRSRPIDQEHADLEQDAPKQKTPASGSARETRMSKRLKHASMNPCASGHSGRDMTSSTAMQAARNLRSRPIDLEHEDLEQDTPEQKALASGSARETRMSKRLKQASIKPESEEVEDEVADDLGADEDDDDEDDDEDEAEVRGILQTFSLCACSAIPAL